MPQIRSRAYPATCRDAAAFARDKQSVRAGIPSLEVCVVLAGLFNAVTLVNAWKEGPHIKLPPERECQMEHIRGR